MTIAVIVVAGGSGSRARQNHGDVPKQYRALGGAPILQRTLDAFCAHDAVDIVVAVIREVDADSYSALKIDGTGKIRAPALGGATRQESVLAGLQALEEAAPTHVLIHDAARPFVSEALIGRVIAALENGAVAAIPALPVSDTLKRVTEKRVMETVDRAGLWSAQTPQGFAFPEILAAHLAARESGETAFTDDASIAEWRGLDTMIVEGERANVKVTTPEDFEIAEYQMSGATVRTGQGYDVHGFTDGESVKLCGVKIPFGQALHGHSDADVGLHALTDAILGAIGDGDIGTHFPPSDPQWRGAASELFLEDAGRRVRECGGAIVNVDVTLICEEPKIGPHRVAMRKAIASVLRVEMGQVSVKATTTEGLGFTGRREGIAAMATAAVRMP